MIEGRALFCHRP